MNKIHQDSESNFDEIMRKIFTDFLQILIKFCIKKYEILIKIHKNV